MAIPPTRFMSGAAAQGLGRANATSQFLRNSEITSNRFCANKIRMRLFRSARLERFELFQRVVVRGVVRHDPFHAQFAKHLPISNGRVDVIPDGLGRRRPADGCPPQVASKCGRPLSFTGITTENVPAV